MVYALKVENRNKLPVLQFIVVGLNRFRQAEHTQDYKPAKIEISLADKARMPYTLTVNDIPVVASDELEPGFLRVITEDIPGVEA